MTAAQIKAITVMQYIFHTSTGNLIQCFQPTAFKVLNKFFALEKMARSYTTISLIRKKYHMSMRPNKYHHYQYLIQTVDQENVPSNSYAVPFFFIRSLNYMV